MGTFTEQEKTDIRRYCGYPVIGDVAANPVMLGYRFFDAYGVLEYRLQYLSPTEESVVRAKLADLMTLDAAIVTATDNLDVDTASVYKHNKNEVNDRVALFTSRRMQLVNILGVPPGPDLADVASGSSIRMVL